MLFNSYIFIFVFLPAAMILYYGLNHFGQYTAAKTALVLLSFLFYGYQTPEYVWILLVSIIVNYGLHSILLKENKAGFRKTCLVFGVLFNLGMLGYFKYLGFFAENFNRLFHGLLPVFSIALPLGISFFTFQQVSFVIDSYYKRMSRYGIVDYALFVSFFPQLIAGPIVLHSEMLPQFENMEKKRINYENIAAGIRYFSMGLAKKVLIADSLGRIVDAGYKDIWALDRWGAVSVMLAYTLQIYFDFSGYCDMALGLGKFFNMDLPINFNSPYKAADIGEFWKRWHMTLTRFFTTYLYIPLGGNRKGKARMYLNVMIVFAVSGLWHGADWSFVLWGIMHGVAQVVHRMVQGRINMPKWMGFLLTFGFVNVTWVFFRADSTLQAVNLFGRMFKGGNGEFPAVGFGVFLLLMAVILFTKNTHEYVGNKELTWKAAAVDIALFVASVFSLSQVSTFLYFNF